VERLAWTTTSRGESQELVRVKTRESRDAVAQYDDAHGGTRYAAWHAQSMVWTESFARGWGWATKRES
jgi:hypothetical protein